MCNGASERATEQANKRASERGTKRTERVSDRARHTLYLGGSNCPTIALSESLDMSPPMHQDSRKNRGKNAPLGIFCQINF